MKGKPITDPPTDIDKIQLVVRGAPSSQPATAGTRLTRQSLLSLSFRGHLLPGPYRSAAAGPLSCAAVPLGLLEHA
jgi:hypothetical protein